MAFSSCFYRTPITTYKLGCFSVTLLSICSVCQIHPYSQVILLFLPFSRISNQICFSCSLPISEMPPPSSQFAWNRKLESSLTFPFSFTYKINYSLLNLALTWVGKYIGLHSSCQKHFYGMTALLSNHRLPIPSLPLFSSPFSIQNDVGYKCNGKWINILES